MITGGPTDTTNTSSGGSMLSDILGALGIGAAAAGGSALTKSAYDRLQRIGEQAVLGTTVDGQRVPGSAELAQQAIEMSQFQPFTVTTTTGSQFGFTPAAMPLYTTPYAAPSTTVPGGPGLATGPGGPGLTDDILIPDFATGPGYIRDAQFIDNNNNGIDDRDEQAPLGSSARLTLSPQEEVMQDMLQQQAESTMLGGPFGAFQRQLAAQQAFGLGGQFMGAAAQQPFDLNLLRGQFAGQVGGMLGQQPSPAIGQFGQQALGMGAAGLGAQAPADIEALRRQYAGLAGQAAQDVLTPAAAREAGVYERIRATQRPEEERQRLALEERLAQQGRLGVRTAMYGGTPEQLAMAQAQEEAQNRASLAAIQQAQAERQQALGTAQTLGGMFGQQAGLSSQLQSAAQQRAAQLSQLGLSAQQIESQLQSEGLGRAATSAQQAAQLAQLAGGLQAQQAGLGAQYAGLGSQLAMQDLAAQQAQQQLALGALTGSYIPQTQLLAAQQAAQLYPQLQQRGQLFGAGQFGETSMAGLEARLVAEQAAANLLGGIGSGLLGGLFNPIATQGGGVGSLFGSLVDMITGD